MRAKLVSKNGLKCRIQVFDITEASKLFSKQLKESKVFSDKTLINIRNTS